MKIEEILRDKGHDVVTITESRSVLDAAGSPGELGSIQVGTVMTRKMITARPDDELTDMMDVMTKNKIRHLPVMDDKRLTGIISIGDLVNACRVVAEEENSQLRQYIQGVG